MISTVSIFGGLVILASLIYPLGTPTTSGTRFDARIPMTWERWKEEALFSLWANNPLRSWQDAIEGYESFGTAVVLTLAFLIALAGVLTGLALIGFGFWYITI